jgi:hypothetical protein
MNELEKFVDVFAGISPFAGIPPRGYLVDWLGAITDARFRAYTGINPKDAGGKFVQTRLPVVSDGEGWFESVNQVEAARNARGSFVMVTLGACYGAQAVGSYLALQKLNPMDCKLVAVEPEPENIAWVAQHFIDNGIEPDDHWLVPLVISNKLDPVFFPVGSPGSGAQNCYATNEAAARAQYVDTILNHGNAAESLRGLLLRNTTGVKKDLVEGQGLAAEIKMLSAVTLRELLAPFKVVDYLEADIQQSEGIVFRPHMSLLRSKVRRIHIGTHGKEVHKVLSNRFRAAGWEIVFDYEPNSEYRTDWGAFAVNDGVLTVVNPAK